MFSLFSPPTLLSSPTPLTLTTMSSPSMAPVPAASPSSENLCDIGGLSSWELLQNHYQCIGSVDKADYFPSVSHYFVHCCSILLTGSSSFQTSSLAVGLDAMRQDPSSVDDEVSGERLNHC